MGPYTVIRKLERHGVTSTQVEAALGEIDSGEVRAIFDGAVPLRRALADRAKAERSDMRRYYAYLVLAGAPAAELARRVGAEGYLRRQGAAVARRVRRSAREGVSDAQLQGAIAAVGRRPVAEALGGRMPFGRWAREGACSARRRRERIAYAQLAAAEPRRVREAIVVRGPERPGERRAEEAARSPRPASAGMPDVASTAGDRE